MGRRGLHIRFGGVRFGTRATAIAAVAVLSLITAGISLGLRVASPVDFSALDTNPTNHDAPWTWEGTVLWRETAGVLRHSDRVVAVGGRSMTHWAERLTDRSAERPTLRPGATLIYRIERDGVPMDVLVTLQPFSLASTLLRNANTVLFVSMLLIVAAYVFAHRSEDPAARALLLVACLAVCATPWWIGSPLGIVDLVAATGFWWHVGGVVSDALLWGALLHCVLVFPRSRPALVRRPRLVGLVYIAPFAIHGVLFAAALWGTTDVVARARLIASLEIASFVYAFAVVLALIHGYWSTRAAADRQRLQWIAVTLGTGLGLYLAIWLMPTIAGEATLLPDDLRFVAFVPPRSSWPPRSGATRRSRSKSPSTGALVYVLLTGCLASIYLGAVWVSRWLSPEREPLSVPSLITIGLAAAVFGPLRERLQRRMSRWLYGERDEPYQAISRLVQRLESAPAPSAVLPTVVETIAQALRLPYAAIELRRGEDVELAAAYGEPVGTLWELPLSYQGEALGQLVLAARSENERLSVADLRLLKDLARQAGVAVHAVRLTERLQAQLEEVRACRARIAEAILDERHKLARDLHDGAQNHLLSVSMRVQAARAKLATIDANGHGRVLAEATNLVEAAGDAARAAGRQLRDIAHGIHPAVLTERGLAAALHDLAERTDLPALVDVPTRRWPRTVEATAYFVVCEALTNVVKHAAARRVTIAADERHGCLIVEVADDGTGTAAPGCGTGLRNLSDRVAAIGGTLTVSSAPGQGTRVVVELPCE